MDVVIKGTEWINHFEAWLFQSLLLVDVVIKIVFDVLLNLFNRVSILVIGGCGHKDRFMKFHPAKDSGFNPCYWWMWS